MCRIALWVRGYVLLLSLSVFVGCVYGQGQKLQPEEIITKHLESIGKRDLIVNSKRIMAIGSSEFLIRIPSKRAVGQAVLASDGKDMAFFSTFDMIDYPMERIGIFGNKVNIPVVKLGNRSPLGAFLRSYDKTLDTRIFGGSIFSTWLFLGQDNSGKLETEGKKKIGDRDAWIVRYTPKGGLTGGSFIKLYFDAENFHHMRTVYRQKEPEAGFANTTAKGTNPTGGWSSDMANNGSTLVEDFEDVRADVGLMLPHKYSITLTLDGAAGTAEYRWNFVIKEYRLIKDFPPEFFSFKTSAG